MAEPTRFVIASAIWRTQPGKAPLPIGHGDSKPCVMIVSPQVGFAARTAKVDASVRKSARLRIFMFFFRVSQRMPNEMRVTYSRPLQALACPQRNAFRHARSGPCLECVR